MERHDCGRKMEPLQPMENQVIILQQGDPWLSNSSLSIVGVFSSEESFKQFAEKLLEKGTISDWGYKSLTGYYGNGRQCDIKNGALIVEHYELNPSVEDCDI